MWWSSCRRADSSELCLDSRWGLASASSVHFGNVQDREQPDLLSRIARYRHEHRKVCGDLGQKIGLLEASSVGMPCTRWTKVAHVRYLKTSRLGDYLAPPSVAFDGGVATEVKESRGRRAPAMLYRYHDQHFSCFSPIIIPTYVIRLRVVVRNMLSMRQLCLEPRASTRPSKYELSGSSGSSEAEEETRACRLLSIGGRSPAEPTQQRAWRCGKEEAPDDRSPAAQFVRRPSQKPQRTSEKNLRQSIWRTAGHHDRAQTDACAFTSLVPRLAALDTAALCKVTSS